MGDKKRKYLGFAWKLIFVAAVTMSVTNAAVLVAVPSPIQTTQDFIGAPIPQVESDYPGVVSWMVHEEKESTLGSMLIGFLLAIVS